MSPGGGVQYAGFVLDYGAGVNNIFIKLQDSSGGGSFNYAACYRGNNGTAFGLGYFILPAPVTTAHMRVTVDSGRNVSIQLTRISGGTGSQVYTCTGAPAVEGDGIGIVGYGGGRVDNVVVNDYVLLKLSYLPLVLR